MFLVGSQNLPRGRRRVGANSALVAGRWVSGEIRATPSIATRPDPGPLRSHQFVEAGVDNRRAADPDHRRVKPAMWHGRQRWVSRLNSRPERSGRNIRQCAVPPQSWSPGFPASDNDAPNALAFAYLAG